jgi:hypothetical protein
MKKLHLLILLILFSFLLISCSSESDNSYYTPVNPKPSEAQVVLANSVSLNYYSITLFEDQVFLLTATIQPINTSNKTLTWSSSNSNVVYVNSSGIISALRQGSATISVRTSNGHTASCNVTVIPNRTIVNISTTNINNYFTISTSVTNVFGSNLTVQALATRNNGIYIENTVFIGTQVTVSIKYRTSSGSTIYSASQTSTGQIMFLSNSSFTSSYVSIPVYFTIPYGSIITSYNISHKVTTASGKIYY